MKHYKQTRINTGITRGRLLLFSHLGLLHLHDVGLAVGDAVVDVVDVGAQGLQLLIQRRQGAVGVRAVYCRFFSFPRHSLTSSSQLLTLLEKRQEQRLEGKEDKEAS